MPTLGYCCRLQPPSLYLYRLSSFSHFTSAKHGAICTAALKRVSMQKDYRQCLDKLAGAVPDTKAALVRSLLPGIEAALNSGQSLKKIWEALASEGLQMSYHSFHKAVWRARRRKPTAASNWGKQDKPLEAQALPETKVEAVEGRDPFANLKRLEENRPGFHWRGTRNMKTPVDRAEDSNDKHNR